MRVLPKILTMVLIVLMLGVGYDGRPRLALYAPHATIAAVPLSSPARRTTRRLTWLGGVELKGSGAAFGGFSSLAVRHGMDGERVLLVGDGGNLVWLRLGTDWRVTAARFGELPDGPRSGWEKRDRDAESTALAPDGRVWIGFESANAIWRYAPGFARAERGVRPPAMRDWPVNGGPEAMARLPDGRFVMLSETGHWSGEPGRAGIVFAGDPTLRPRDGFGFSYLPAAGFDPSDAAVLPNGDLLVLERKWLWPVSFRSRLVLVPRETLKPGVRVRGVELGRIAPPLPTENYEGLAVTREGKATIIWLVSDNDQMFWRPSYLLKFRLD